MLMQSTHSERKMPKDLKVLKRNFLLEEEHFNFKLQFTDIKDCHFAPFLLWLKGKVGKIFKRATANDQKNEMHYFMGSVFLLTLASNCSSFVSKTIDAR